MKKLLSLVAAASLLAFAPAPASAATFIETQAQTSNGQTFLFSFANVPPPLGAGVLSFLVRGDFSIDASLGESFGFDFDGILAQAGLQATNANLIESFDFNDNLFRVSFDLTQTQLALASADGAINLGVVFGPGVDVERSANPFITASLDFPSAAAAVPEPATWATMLLGFGAIGHSLRRRGRREAVRLTA